LQNKRNGTRRLSASGAARSLDIAACERILDRPGGGVSATDHFGAVADLAVRPREPAVMG
jgi:hypothetical protein